MYREGTTDEMIRYLRSASTESSWGPGGGVQGDEEGRLATS